MSMYTNIDKLRAAYEGGMSRMVALLLLVTPFALWKLVDIAIWLVEHVSIKP